MPLKLLPLHVSHLPRYCQITANSFHDSGCPNQRAMFPLGPTPELQKAFLGYQLTAMNETRGVVFVGVFDLPENDTGAFSGPAPNGHTPEDKKLTNGSSPHDQEATIPPPESLIAVARIRLEDALTFSAPQQSRTPPPGSNTTAYSAFFAMLGTAKLETMGARTYWNLDSLATATEAQGRGAGRMIVEALISWAEGTVGADGEVGVECFLEATDMGRPLYEKLGFEVVRECSMQCTRFGQKTDGRMSIMVRPRKGEREARAKAAAAPTPKARGVVDGLREKGDCTADVRVVSCELDPVRVPSVV